MRIPCLLLAGLLLLGSCTASQRSPRIPDATVLAAGDYPGGHFQLLDDNRLRVLLQFNEAVIDGSSNQPSWSYYGSRPYKLPDQEVLADRELLSGNNGWLGTCRRDGYFEVWSEDDPNNGFFRLEDLYTPLPIWDGSQYPVTDTCRLLDDAVLTTAQQQSVRSFSYEGHEQWQFLMGAPARLLIDGDSIYAASDDGWLYCLDMDGELRWQKESASHHADLPEKGRLVYPSPGGRLSCVDSTGTELWTADIASDIEEMRCSGGMVWLEAEGGLRCLNAEGTSVRIDWPQDRRVQDLVAGLSGEVFVSSVPDEAAVAANQPGAIGAAQLPVTGSLHCYDSRGNCLWRYDGMDPGMRIIPAHERQCWLVNLSVQTNLQNTLRRIGLPITSQGA